MHTIDIYWKGSTWWIWAKIWNSGDCGLDQVWGTQSRPVHKWDHTTWITWYQRNGTMKATVDSGQCKASTAPPMLVAPAAATQQAWTNCGCCRYVPKCDGAKSKPRCRIYNGKLWFGGISFSWLSQGSLGSTNQNATFLPPDARHICYHGWQGARSCWCC